MEIKTETKTIITTTIELNSKEAEYLKDFMGNISLNMVKDIMKNNYYPDRESKDIAEINSLIEILYKKL